MAAAGSSSSTSPQPHSLRTTCTLCSMTGTLSLSPGGDVVASICVTETPTDCVLRWESAFNASDPSHAYSWLTTPPVVSYGVSVQSADIACAIRMQNILYNGPGSGFLVLALSTGTTTSLHWCACSSSSGAE